MIELVRLTLVVDTDTSDVDINPIHVETIIDATPFQKGAKCTQIRMISGTSLFVKESIDEVRSLLINKE